MISTLTLFQTRVLCSAAHAFPGTFCSVQAQTLTTEQARKQVAPFYEMLNQPASKNLKALADQALSLDWKSYSSQTEFKDRDAFVGQVTGIGKLIPDHTRDIQDVMVDGNKIIV